MNQILQPYMRQVRSYCKNATHVVNILKNIKVLPTSYLASLDIQSLYANISFDMAIKVFLKIFAKHPRLVLYLDLLKFVFKNSVFNLAGKFTIKSVASPWAQRWRPLLPLLSLCTMRKIPRLSLSKTSSVETLY